MELGAASADHLVKTSDADIAALGRSDTVAVALPCTPFGLAERDYTPADKLIKVDAILADELDADWSKVKIDQAIGDPKYGEQDTDGSHSVRSFFDQMRQVGAAGRGMLISAAAAQWNVSPKDCTTEPHFVVHKASGRKAGYGELAAAAAKLPVPKW